jgi:hypothetical protein
MIKSSFDLWIAIGVVVLMPPIIWANLRHRQSGIMGYLWRESPWLARIGLSFLALVWLSSAIELATVYGLVSENGAQLMATVLGVPMLALSLTILVMAAIVLARYLKSRPSA